MRYLIYALIGFAILLVIAWQLAVFFIGLAIGLFKILLLVALTVSFIMGWKSKGFLEQHRKNKALDYLSTTEKRA